MTSSSWILTVSWFVPGYRYAVLETIKVYQALPPYTPILQTAFYNTIDDQANLPDDEENIAIRKAVAKTDSPNRNASQRAKGSGIARYLNDNIVASVSRKGNGAKFSIDYKAECSEKFSVSLYNLSGMQVFSKDLGCKKKGLYNDNFSVNSLLKGGMFWPSSQMVLRIPRKSRCKILCW